MSRRSPTIPVVLAAAALVALAVAVAVSSVAGPASAASPPTRAPVAGPASAASPLTRAPVAASLARRADRDAAALVRLVRPRAAVRIAAAPVRALQRPASGPPATPQVAVRARVWRVPGIAPRALLRRLDARMPDAATLVERGVGRRHGVLELRFAGFRLPALTGLPERWVVVGAAPYRGGSALRADGQSVWSAPAPAPHVPRGTRRVTATALQGARRSDVAQLRSRRAVRTAVRAVDALRAFSPGAMSCPADLGPALRLLFHGAGGRVLARALVDRTGCAEVTVRVPGRATWRYAGGDALARELAPLLPAGFVGTESRASRDR